MTRIFCCGLTPSGLSRQHRGLPRMKTLCCSSTWAVVPSSQIRRISNFGFFSYMLSNGVKLVVFRFFLWCHDLNLSSLKSAHLYTTSSMPWTDFMWFQESFTETVSHPRPFFYNIHLAPTGKAIKSQRKLEMSHIYTFTASSLWSTKISGCLKKPWKYMYRYTHSRVSAGTNFHDGKHCLCPCRNWVITTSDPWGHKTKMMPHYC